MTVPEGVLIWKEMNEVLSNFVPGSKVEVTTSCGRTYKLGMEKQNSEGTWEKVRYFVRTDGKCKVCQNMFSGQWATVWHNQDVVNVPSHWLHRSLSHPSNLADDDFTGIIQEEFKRVFLN